MSALRVWVDTGGGFVQLPDERVGKAPYAVVSLSAEKAFGGFTANGLIESTSDGFKFPDGTIQTSAAGAGAFWSLTGNAGTNPSTNYLGTTDEVMLRLVVGGRRAIRIDATGFDGESDPYAPNLVCGRANNSVPDGVYGATISGGGAKDGEGNQVTDIYGTVGGGIDNLAGDNDEDPEDAPYATVGGGRTNRAREYYATVAGGRDNLASAQNSSIGGGNGNQASGGNATIGGGYDNHANGYGSAIPGGAGCIVTAEADYSLAAGHNATADEEGAFVWADNSSAATMDSKGANSFTIRAANGVKIADSGNVVRFKLNPTTGVLSTPTLQITGGIDLAEPFDMSDEDELPLGSVVVIDEHKPGQLRMSTTPYDTRVAGIISGAGGIQPGVTLKQTGVQDSGQYVALTGRVYVQADATNEPIQPGDLLTTSSIPGHAMRAADVTRRPGAIIGKAMSSLESGRGLVLVLVTLQ